MIKVRFVSADGRTTIEALAHPGDTLLSVAQANGLPLEGTCEGAMACSTCHVIVDPAFAEKLPRASAEEDDLLDFAEDVAPTSRLSCQITLTRALDGLTVRLPRAHRNVSA